MPVLLNLLPAAATATVSSYEAADTSLGLIHLSVQGSRQEDKQVKCYVLFHLEDVVDGKGGPAALDGGVTIRSLRGVSVDLVARGIGAGESCSDLTRLLARVEADYPDAQV